MLPLVITVEQVDGGTRRYAFTDSPVSIGRSPFAELQLSEPFISRWEGTLRFDADEMTYFRLGATNTTYVNGKPLAQREDDVPLSVDSVLTLGDLELRFSREPVPESDLRSKGKRRPTRESTDTEIKTLYLDADAPTLSRRAPAAAAPLAPSAPAEGPFQPRVPPLTAIVAHHAATIAPQFCIVLGDEPRVQPSVSSARQPHVQQLDTAAEGRSAAPQRATASGAPAAADDVRSGDVPGSVTALHHAYREARAALLVDLRTQLEALPAAERAEFLTALIRREPTLASDPDLQLELQRAGLRQPSEIPELRAWLHATSPESFPHDLPFDHQLALTRVLGLLQAFAQSLAEIHDAQESVRRRWLGRSARRSILQSEDGNVVLAYLLHPHADWNERLRELEESVRDVVTHELALFRATLEGARTLVHALSPEVITSSANADGDADGGDSAPGFWTRLLCKDAGDIGLWRRFLATYDELTDGAHYERIFLGRVFSRSYLAAMGRSDPSRA